MFDKLSFEELANFYGALSDLEKKYGANAVKDAVKVMADKLDSQQPKIRYDVKSADLMALAEKQMEPVGDIRIIDEQVGIDVTVPAEQIKMNLPTETSTKEVIKRGTRRTKEKIKAEKIAKEYGMTLEQYLVVGYYHKKMNQSHIADLLGVSFPTVSRWIREIPQKSIKKWVGGPNE